MNNHFMVIYGWAYSIVALLLTIISVNMLFLTALYWIRGRRKNRYPSRPVKPIHWPVVTVQLPIFNEELVASRLIDAIAEMDYPEDKLFIQVLDDSTDQTRQIVQERVEHWKKCGRWIVDYHRENRVDYKAGALKEGLASAQGDYIAIFDADFVPNKDWMKKVLLPYFEAGSEHLGLVQTRWAHINDDYSILTRAQALGLDGHFAIEQNMRNAFGFLINFNGTAGIWRRKCIEDAGNWSGQTLSEDLDLSYRAQLKGWRVRYLENVSVPAELPTLMVGFKRQQFRWSKGSAQVARILGKRILTSDIGIGRKIQGLVHLFNHMAHPLMVLILIMTLPLFLWGQKIIPHLPIGRIGLIGLALPLFYATAQFELYGSKALFRWLVRMPLLAMLGVGIAVNNSRAVIEGLTSRPNIFERTPKTGATKNKRTPNSVVRERFIIDRSTFIELFLSLYAFAISVVAIAQLNIGAGALFAIYAFGFLWVGGATIVEAYATA